MREVGIIMPGESFQFPPHPGVSNTITMGIGSGENNSDSDGEDGDSSELSPMSKVDRSNSAPNVSHTIIPTNAPLPEYLLRSQKKDMRTQGMVPLDELFCPKPTSSTAATISNATAAAPVVAPATTGSN